MFDILQFDAELLYDLWIMALTLVFSSSIVLFGIYFKSRGTPHGRNAFCVAISALIWSIAGAIYSIPNIIELQFGSSFFFLSLASLAGVVTTIGAYERARIQVILTQSDERLSHKFSFLAILTTLPLVVALFAIINLAVNNSFLNATVGTTTPITLLCLILIGISLTGLFRPSFPRKLVYITSGTVFIINVAVLAGYSLNLPLGPFWFGTGTLATAKALTVASLCLFLATKTGLKAWVIKINLAMAVVIMVILEFIGFSVHHPAFFSLPTATCLFIVGVALLSRTWRLHKYKVPQLFIL